MHLMQRRMVSAKKPDAIARHRRCIHPITLLADDIRRYIGVRCKLPDKSKFPCGFSLGQVAHFP